MESDQDTPSVKVELFRAGELIDPDYDLPSQVLDIWMTDVTEKSMTLNWKPPTRGFKHIKNYEIKLLRNIGDNETSKAYNKAHIQNVVNACTVYEAKIDA